MFIPRWFSVMPFVVLAAAACSQAGPEGAGDPGSLEVGDPVAPDTLGDPAATCAVGAASDSLTVATDRGLVRGAQTSGVARFLGVPFAAPPVGPLRLRPPVLAACWAGVRDATAYAPACAQRDLLTGSLSGAEDCLYVNVWTPKAALTDGRARPVMYWIYGGANVQGATNVPGLTGGNTYDGQFLAEERDVVVVSVAYRVGPLGFLAHPALRAESAVGSSGSYGILDVIAGLEWVHRNVAKFGGDPAKVMVFGESAGGINTCTLLASPLAAGLFSSVAMESGFCVAQTLAEGEAQGQTFAASVGCDDPATAAACLRALDPLDLTAAFTTDTGGVDPLVALRAIPAGLIDGWLLPKHPLAAMRAGEHNQVPAILGSNSDENALFLLTKLVLTCSAFEREIATAYPAHKAEILALYPCSFFNPKQALVDVQTDSTFTCSQRRTARALTIGQTAPVHRYFFTYVSPLSLALGAYHTAEIPFVFGNYRAPLSLPNPTEDRLSDALQGYWTRFVATGSPNTPGAANWAPYDAARDNTLQIGATVTSIEAVRAARCDFWDAVTPE